MICQDRLDDYIKLFDIDSALKLSFIYIYIYIYIRLIGFINK